MTCLCDPTIRCTECHGCECRPGTCVWCTGTGRPRWRPPRYAATYDRAIELTRAGWSAARIGAELGIAARTVEKWRRRERETRGLEVTVPGVGSTSNTERHPSPGTVGGGAQRRRGTATATADASIAVSGSSPNTA